MKALRIRLMLVFSSTIFTTIFSLVHAYAILHDLGYMEFMFAVVEVRFLSSSFKLLIESHSTPQMVVSLLVVNLTVISSWIFRLTDEDSHSGPSAHMNTFLRGERRGHGKNHELTTFGLTTFSPAHIEITTEVDTGKDELDGRMGHTIQFLSPSSENVDDGGTIEKKYTY